MMMYQDRGSPLDSPQDVDMYKPSDGASGSHVLAGAGVPECTNLTETKALGSVGVISLQTELTKDKVLFEYVLAGAGVPECTSFIETKAFDRLKTKTLADGNSDPVLLLGAKGCGKTLSLVALLTILVNAGKTTLYLTSKTLRSVLTYTVLQYTQCNKNCLF